MLHKIYVMLLTVSLCNLTLAETIFLDFGAAWNARLDELEASVGGGVNYNPAERVALQNNIEARLSTMYSEFSGVTFTQTAPGSGAFTTVNFGDTTTPGGLGVASLDYGNLFTMQEVKVFTANFNFIVESFEAEATQLDELGAALSGTAGHELGHAFGLLHHHAYGTDGISPTNYAGTGGLQNQHVIATGSTGLGEIGRETDRTFSEFSKLILEAAGGFNVGLFGPQVGRALAAVPLAQIDNFSGGDVGDTAGTAFATPLQSMAISGLDAFTNFSQLSSEADVDVYSFTTTGPSQLFAQLWSDFRYFNDFDGRLRLLDTNGFDVLASNTDVFYSGNTFNGGTFRQNDSALVGIDIAAPGTYFLEVSSVANIGGGSGGDYSLIFGLDQADSAVPEPSSFVLMVGLFGLGYTLRKRNKAA